jgi:hypothetical protein
MKKAFETLFSGFKRFFHVSNAFFWFETLFSGLKRSF